MDTLSTQNRSICPILLILISKLPEKGQIIQHLLLFPKPAYWTENFLSTPGFSYITFSIHIIDHLGYFFHISNLSLQIYGDFHKSFRNLPKFFREHARGARAIFHLCN